MIVASIRFSFPFFVMELFLNSSKLFVPSVCSNISITLTRHGENMIQVRRFQVSHFEIVTSSCFYDYINLYGDPHMVVTTRELIKNFGYSKRLYRDILDPLL